MAVANIDEIVLELQSRPTVVVESQGYLPLLWENEMEHRNLGKLQERFSVCAILLTTCLLVVSLGCQKKAKDDDPAQMSEADTAEHGGQWAYSVVTEYRFSQGPIMVAEGEEDKAVIDSSGPPQASDLFHVIATTVPGGDSPQAKQVFAEAKMAIQEALVGHISWEERSAPPTGSVIVWRMW